MQKVLSRIVTAFLALFVSSAAHAQGYQFVLAIGGGQFKSPAGLTELAPETLYISDTGNGRVVKSNTKGTGIIALSGTFNAPAGIAADRAGNVAVVDNGQVEEFAANGSRLFTLGSDKVNHPGNVAFDTAGFLYVTDTEDVPVSSGNGRIQRYLRVQKFNTNGAVTQQIRVALYFTGDASYGKFPAAQGLAVDRFGNLFVGSEYGPPVQKFDAEGNRVGAVGGYGTGNGTFAYVRSLAVDSFGNVYVLDRDRKTVQKFDNDGRYITQFGGSGTGAGQFSQPVSVATDSASSVLVLDSATGTISTFNATNSLSATDTISGVPNIAAASLDSIAVEFRAPGTTVPLFVEKVPLAPVNGNVGVLYLNVPGLPAGTYDVALKTPKTLRRVFPNIVIANSSRGSLPPVRLASGDANDDNTVDIGDFGILVNAYNGSANVSGSGYDPAADFNYDGVVDIADFGILVNNYNASGDL